MIASLMMYARPELAGPHARYWALIRDALRDAGIDSPAALSDDADEFEVWRDPDLVLSQTCGMPYRKWLHDGVTLVGTPDYGIAGCPPGYYNSGMVVRADDPRTDLADFCAARFTYNQTFSQSGYAAPYALCRENGFWFKDRVQSHGHRNSARALAEGHADIAAIDAVTWRFVRQFDDFAAKLRVLCHTSPTPGLPYIAGQNADQAKTFNAVRSAIAALAPADRNALALRDLIAIPKADYLAVPNPPETED